MKALLLLAGRGTRLRHRTQNTPKSLLEISGKPILNHIMDRIIVNNINDFVFVVGFQKEKIIDFLEKNYSTVNLKFIENPIFEKTNTLYSMHLAKNELLNKNFLYLHGDLILNKNMISKILSSEYKNAALIAPQEESMQVFGFGKTITKITKKRDSVGKALGVYKFCDSASKRLFEESEKVIKSGNINAFQSEAINPTIAYHKMNLVHTEDMSWIEIDEEHDLLRAEHILKKILEEEMHQNVRDMRI